MRKTLMAVLLISVIFVAVAIPLLLSHAQNQTSDQNGNGDLDQTESEGVKIAKFEWTSGWGPGAGGLRWGRAFNITLQNLGDSAVEGLSVYVKLFVNDAEVIWSETGLYGPGIIGYTAEYPHGFDGKLNASETREIRGDFVSGLDVLDAQVWSQEGQKVFSVRVTMNDTIMDELLLPLT
jgi:hypothetical protein